MKTKARIMPINAALLAVGLVDLLTTLFWLGTGRAVEINPIMAAVLDTGLLLFVLVKLATLGTYIAVMEWYRRFRNPAFAGLVGNFTVIAYLCIYAVSFYSVNHSYFLG
ncbi:MAG: DUF5658 family protein [Armatimonadota bacterium]